MALEPPRVLVVDDHKDSADTLAFLASLWSYDAKAVYSSEEALALASTWKPHVAVLELALPRMDGYALAPELRRRALPEKVILVALSALTSPKQQERSKEAGFFTHFSKPANPEELRSVLTTIAPPSRLGANDQAINLLQDLAVRAFVEHSCLRDSSARESMILLWSAFCLFCQIVNGETGKPERFFERLQDHGAHLEANWRVRGLKVRQTALAEIGLGLASQDSSGDIKDLPTLMFRAGVAVAVGLKRGRELARHLEDGAVLAEESVAIYEEMLAEGLLRRPAPLRHRRRFRKTLPAGR